MCTLHAATQLYTITQSKYMNLNWNQTVKEIKMDHIKICALFQCKTEHIQ